MRVIALIFTLIAVAPAWGSDEVRMSSSGICHPKDSPYYDKVSSKRTYETLSACLAQENARLPKGYTPTHNERNAISLETRSLTEGITSGRSALPNTYIVKFPYYTLWVDCNEKAAIRFFYTARRDAGNQSRPDKYYPLPNSILPNECQQKIENTYKGGDTAYHRGHLAPANHFEMSKVAKFQANFMVNILPQTAIFNKGAWYDTEVLVECYRDISTLKVYGGVIWGDDKSNDHFVSSHGVRTPDAYWKIIKREDTGDVITFIIPNDGSATSENTSRFIVSVAELENKLGMNINVGEVNKTVKAQLWPTPFMCNLG